MSNSNDFVIEKGVLKKYRGKDSNVVVPDGVTSIGAEAFYSSFTLTKIMLPDSVTHIGDEAFKYCSDLTEINLPEGLKSIGDEAFYHCLRLTEITLPDGLKSIGKRAFSGCWELTKITLPKGITSISSAEFEECRSLANIFVSEDNPVYKSVDGLLLNKDGSELICCPEGKDDKVTVPAGVTSIGYGAFRKCQHPWEITLPNSLVSINGCDVRTITLPDRITNVTASMFSRCKGLENIFVGEDNPSYKNVDGMLMSKDGSKLIYCPNGKSLTEVTLPEGLTSIGNAAFYDCKKLTKVTLPDGLKSIEDGAFNFCRSLTKINLPEGLTSIGDYVFYYCESLIKINLPDSLKSIGDEAFFGCKSLRDIILPNGVEAIGENAFAFCGSLKELNLPAGLVSLGKSTFYQCTGLEKITFSKISMENVKGLLQGLSEGDVKKSLLNKATWNTLSSEVQLCIFTHFNKNSMAESYEKCITKEQIEQIGGGILNALSQNPSTKEFNAAAAFVRMFISKVPNQLLVNIYNCLKGLPKASKAVKKIEEDTVTMQKLNIGSDKAESTSATAEQTVTQYLIKSGTSIMDLEKKLKDYYGIAFSNLPKVKNKNGKEEKPFVFAWLMSVHEKKDNYYGVSVAYEQPGICPEAEAVVSELDDLSLQNAFLEIADNYFGLSGRGKKIYLAYPICRYANEQTMSKLCRQAPKWRKGDSLAVFCKAVIYNNSRSAMLFADKNKMLGTFARLRGMDSISFRDTVLSNFDLDESGKKVYDLGNSTVTVTLNSDLTLGLYDNAVGKVVKSIPKKNADPVKYEAVKADFADLKKNVKNVVKARNDLLFEAFLNGKRFAATQWQASYTKNPVLNMVAQLLVWEQDGKTFTLNANGAIDSSENEYIFSDSKIGVAHPMDMLQGDIAAWQKYFTAHRLKQPFAQVWEPVIDSKTIKPDRYKGDMIPYYRFIKQEKHGITVIDEDYHDEIYIKFEDCLAGVQRIDFRSHSIEVTDRFEVWKFEYENYTRKVNHIVSLLDKWTIVGRIQSDDASAVSALLNGFTLAQITEFIAVAQEAKASNVLALLLEYKNTHFSDFNPMDEFTLD